MIKLDEFTKDELETLKELVDDEISSCYRMKELTQLDRVKSKKDKKIQELGLLRVKIGNLVGDYQHGMTH